MTSIYKLIGIIAVFINFNYAAYDAIVLIASKGCIPYSAIKAQQSIRRATLSSESLDSYDAHKDSRSFTPCYEQRLDAPLLSRDDRHMVSGSLSLPHVLSKVESTALTLDTSAELTRTELAVNEGDRADVVNSVNIGISSVGPEFPSSPLIPFQSVEGESPTTEEGPGALNQSIGSSFAVISSAVPVSSIPSLGAAGGFSISESAGMLSRRQSVANFDDIFSSDEEGLETETSIFASDLSFTGLVSEKDSNSPDNDPHSLEYLKGEFWETVVTDSDEELPIMFSRPRAVKRTLYRPCNEKVTVTFAKNNCRENIVRSNPAIIDRGKVSHAVMERSVINHPPLTPLNSVCRSLPKADSRSDNSRLREAKRNCLLPVELEYNPSFQIEVVKIKTR